MFYTLLLHAAHILWTTVFIYSLQGFSLLPTRLKDVLQKHIHFTLALQIEYQIRIEK